MSSSTVESSDLVSRFHEQGFVISRGFLPPDELRELRDNLARYIDEIVPDLPDSAAFFQDKSRPETLKQMQHMGVDPFFAAYKNRERWVNFAEQLLGESVDPQGCEWFNKPPHEQHVTPPHQDNYYFCMRPPNVCTFWLALDDIDEGNGCLRYVAGSHRRGIRPHARTAVLGFSQGITDYGDDDRRREASVTLRPGDLAVHHGNTIHRADANGSDRQRRAFAIVFYGKSCKRDPAAYDKYQAQVKGQHDSLGLQS